MMAKADAAFWILRARELHEAATTRRSVFSSVFSLRCSCPSRGIDGGADPANIGFQRWPLLQANHDDRNPAPREILLVANILVGDQQHVEACRLGDVEQVTVLQG